MPSLSPQKPGLDLAVPESSGECPLWRSDLPSMSRLQNRYGE